MPAHSTFTTSEGEHVVVGASAYDTDLLEAIRAASSVSTRTLRLYAVPDLVNLYRIAEMAEGLGWSPRFSFPGFACADIIDMHLGGGL